MGLFIMKLKIWFSIILLNIFFAIDAFAQFEDRFFENVNFKDSILLKNKIISQTEYISMDDSTWIKHGYNENNNYGLPSIMIQYDESGNESEKLVFTYDSLGQINNIESYNRNRKSSGANFIVNNKGLIFSSTSYSYQTYDNKIITHNTNYYYYNPNNLISKKIAIGENDKDTTQITYFDSLGRKKLNIWSPQKTWTQKVEYIYSNDSGDTKEIISTNDNKIADTIIHKFKNCKEVESYSSVTGYKFYWKYDSEGRLIETNSGFYDIKYYTYDKEGRLKTMTILMLFSDSSADKDLPKKMYFKYEYKLKN